jgi:hypothetical protein
VIPSKISQDCATVTPAEIAQHVAQLIDEALIDMRSGEAAAQTVEAAQRARLESVSTSKISHSEGVSGAG